MHSDQYTHCRRNCTSVVVGVVVVLGLVIPVAVIGAVNVVFAFIVFYTDSHTESSSCGKTYLGSLIS